MSEEVLRSIGGVPTQVTISVPVTQTNAVYVSKAGSDSSTGLTQGDPKLTIAAALAVASGLAPTTSNRITVYIQDAGSYAEGPLSIPAYVTVDGPAAQLNTASGGFILGLESTLTIYKVTAGGHCVDCQGAGKAWVNAAWLNCTGAGGVNALTVSNISAVVYVDIDTISTATSNGLLISAAGAKVVGRIGEITGSNVGLVSLVACEFDLNIGKLATATGLSLGLTAVAYLVIQDFSPTAQGALSGTSVAKIFASKASGTAFTGTGTGTVEEPGGGGGTIGGTGTPNSVAYWSGVSTLNNAPFSVNGGQLQIDSGNIIWAAGNNAEIAGPGIIVLDAGSDVAALPQVRIAADGVQWLTFDGNAEKIDFQNGGEIGTGGDLTITLFGGSNALIGSAPYNLGKSSDRWGALYFSTRIDWATTMSFDQNGTTRMSIDSVNGDLTLENDLVVGNGGTGIVSLGSLASNNRIFGAATGVLTVRSATGENIEFQPGGTNTWIKMLAEGAILITRPFTGPFANEQPDPADIGVSSGALFVYEASGTTSGEVLGWMDQNGDVQKVSANWTHESCRVATTANITLSNLQTIDSVSLSAGDRVLCKDQTTLADKGIYIVVDLGAWTRAPDYAINMGYTAHGAGSGGAMVWVRNGTANGGKLWVETAVNPGSVGVGNETWAALADVNAVGSMEASGTVVATAIPFYSDTVGDSLTDSNFLINDANNQLIVPAEGGIYWGALNATPNIDESAGNLFIRNTGFLVEIQAALVTINSVGAVDIGGSTVDLSGTNLTANFSGAINLDAGANSNVTIYEAGVAWGTFDGNLRDLALKNLSTVEWLRFDSSLQRINFSGNGNIYSGGALELAATSIVLDSAVDINLQVGTNDSFIFQENTTIRMEFDTSLHQLKILGQGNLNNSSILRLTEDGTGNFVGGFMQMDGLGNRLVIGTHNLADTTVGNDIPVILLDRVGGQVGIIGANVVPFNVVNPLQVRGDTTGSVCQLENESAADVHSIIRAKHLGVSVISPSSYWMRCEGSSGSVMGGIRGGGNNTVVVYATFAGEHDGQITGSTWTGTTINDGTTNLDSGMILVSDGTCVTDGVDTCEQPKVLLPVAGANNKAVVGVYSSGGDLAAAADSMGFDPLLPVAHYRALGHGLILVTDESGDVNNGDLITTSASSTGYGQKQADDIIHSYTVAKSFSDVDWVNVTDTINGHKYALVPCFVYCG